MSVFNTDFSTVKRAIDSVLNQTYTNFELLLIDDGSTNESHKQLLSYAVKNEDKITYVRHKNCSQALSVNKGVLLSKGAFITIIDADDEYKANHLEACLEQIGNYDLIASTTETVVTEDAHYFVPNRFDVSQNIHVDECILFATLFGKKHVFESFQFKNMYAADADFYDMAAKNFKVKKLNLRTYIYYRDQPNSITATLKRKEIGLENSNF